MVNYAFRSASFISICLLNKVGFMSTMVSAGTVLNGFELYLNELRAVERVI